MSFSTISELLETQYQLCSPGFEFEFLEFQTKDDVSRLRTKAPFGQILAKAHTLLDPDTKEVLWMFKFGGSGGETVVYTMPIPDKLFSNCGLFENSEKQLGKDDWDLKEEAEVFCRMLVERCGDDVCTQQPKKPVKVDGQEEINVVDSDGGPTAAKVPAL
jgi:hypothetical protein